MRLSFHGRWTEDQSQLHINILEIMAIRFALKKSHNIYSLFLRRVLCRQNDSGLLYQQTRWNTFSQSMYRGIGAWNTM